MKNNYTIPIMLFLCFAGANAKVPNSIKKSCDTLNKSINYETKIYEQQIIDAIEKLREQLKEEGYPDLGVPPLDPLYFENKQFLVNIDKLINLNLNLTLYSEGLLTFEITNLNIGLIGLKFDFTVIWPLVLAKGKYELDANTPLIPIKIFGDGDLNLEASNFTIVGTGNLNTTTVDDKMHIIIQKAEVDVQISKFDFLITGALGSEDVSKLISKGLSSAMPQILQDIRGDINDLLAQALGKINDWIVSRNLLKRSKAAQIFQLVCTDV